MEDLDRVLGGVTYNYGKFSVVIPDDETEPYNAAMRIYIGGLVAYSKREGKTLEETQRMRGQSEETDQVIRYYWDRVILNN